MEFEFYEDSSYQLWINWKESEGNVYFDLNQAPPAVENPETYDLERYYVDYGRWTPTSLLVDEEGNTEIGTVYLRLDPAHSVAYSSDTPRMWTLPEYDYCPTIYMEYPLEGALGEWFAGPVVVDGEAVSDFVRFEDNVLSFTPINEQPVIIHIFWSKEDRAFWDFDTTEEKPVMVELMLGDRVPVQLPADIPAEDVKIWHAAEHDYVRVRVPADRESVKITWPRVGIVALIEEDGAGENGEPLRVNFPTERAYEIRLNQQEWDGSPRAFYYATFWGFDWVENPFVDVADDAWYHEAVLFAVTMRITSGTDATHFSPDASCTRAQIVTFLYAAAGKPEFEMPDASFSDVKETDWYYTPVMWALSAGITAGMGDGSFGANSTCTRAQIVTFLYAAAGKPAEFEKPDTSFYDVAEGDWFYTPVMWALSKGITAGMGDGSFGVNATCNRAMAVMFLFRHTLNTWRDAE